MVKKTKAIKRNDGFKQVCIWPGTSMGNNTPADFENFIRETFGVESQFLEVCITKPDMEGTEPVKDTGGRSDLFFAIADKDTAKFAFVRLEYGIRWLDDFLDNGGLRLHDEHINEYRSW